MQKISMLQIGKAGEYLVCADLILNGHIAFLSEQGLPFDVVFQYNHKLYKIQVKTTNGFRLKPQAVGNIDVFLFHVGVNGRFGKKRIYNSDQVDLFALVDLQSKMIAYIPYQETKSTMTFRVPALRGTYWDERAEKNKQIVLELKSKGKSANEICSITGLTKSNVYKLSSKASIKQKGTHAGTYFDQLTLQNCINKMGI